MSTDYWARLVLGFHIRLEDLWQEVPSEPRCKCGRAPDGAGPFCSKCGTKFEGHSIQEPVPGLTQFCKEEDLDPECFRQVNGGGGIGLYPSAEVYGYEYDGGHLLGFRVHRTRSSGSPGKSNSKAIKTADLMQLEAKLRKCQQMLGIYPREIGLFLSLVRS